jgi:hypothetical protein
MKDYFNLRKSKLLLFTLLAALAGGVSPAWAQKALPYSYGFEDYNLATDGWTKTITTTLTSNNNECAIVGAAKKTGSYGFRFSSANTSGANAQYLISPELNGSNGVDVSFYYKSSNTGTYGTESFKVGYSTTDTDVSSFTWGEENTTNAASWLLYEESFPVGTKYVAIYYYSNYKYRLYVDDFSFTAPANGPALAVADGSTTINSGYNYNFGLATPGTVHYFTLSNPGTEAITLNIEATNGFSTDNTSLTLDAQASVLLHVIMADATATGTVTITPTAAGIDPFVINVSGTIADPNKVFETLLTGSIPTDWTTSGGTWSWSTTNGASNTAWYESSNYRLITPLLTVADGETFSFDAQGTYANYQGVVFEYSADGTTWIASETTTTVSSDWQTFAISDIPAGRYYIALHGWHVNIRNFYGGELYVPDGAKFAIDPAGTTQNLGLTAIGGNLEKTFTVTNAGNENLTVTFTAPTGFDVVGKSTTFLLTDNFGWGSALVYAWDANQNPLNGAWPGTVYAETVTNDMNETQFKVVVPNGAVGVIVNNGNGTQTENITDFSSFEGFWMDGSTDSEGHYKVTGWGTYSNPAISSLTVAAGESKSFTVKMNTATAGAKSGTLSLALSDNVLEATNPYEIALSGTVMPEGAMVVDFSNNSLPDGWTNDASYKWSFGDQSAYCTASTSSPAELISKKLDFTTNNYFVLTAASNYNDDDCFIKVLGSSDNGSTWTAYSKTIKGRSVIPYGSYADVVVDEIPATVNKLKFQGYYARIKQFAGLTYDANDPKLAITSDAEGNTEVASGTACELGWVKADASATYYIKNAGTGTLTIESITAPDGISATTASNATTVTTGTLALTISMAAANNAGAHTGNIVITTDGGNFEIPVSGVVCEEGKLYLDFSADGAAFPAGWSTGSWNISGNTAVASGNLQTTKLVAKAGDHMVIEAISTGSYYSTASLSYTILSADDNSELVASTAITPQLNTSTYSIIDLGEVNAAEDANVIVKFIGSNVSVRRIYGFEAVAVAVMETTAANIAFGMQTAESDEQSFTISNIGDAEMTGLSVTLGKTDAEAEYAIRMTKDDAEFTGTTLAKDETVTVYVKQLFDINNVGSKSDVLTIAADDQTTKTINLTGSTRNPAILYVDFDEPNAFPTNWQAGANWSVYTYGSDRYAYQSSSNTPSALVTTPLTVEDGQSLSFKVARNSSGYGYTTSLKTRYSQDGGATWSNYVAQYGTDSNNEAGSGYTTIELSDLPIGDLIFEFYGNNIKLDMIQGLKTANAPAMALTESDAAVVNGSTKAFESLKAEGTAIYTLKNIGNADMVSTVSITGGATVAISGEGVTISENTVTLAAGKSATITLTVPFEAPYADMIGTMTITTEGWVGDFAVNYTATLVDPTDFVEDFSAGKPAGWYFDTWTVASDVARVYSGVNKTMITEKFEATADNNVLSFDAKTYYNSEEETLNVYTSTDRKMWSEAQTFNVTSTEQTFSLAALTAGQYYVMFEAANITVDNVKGVKRILPVPAHDLYEVSTTMAASGTPGASYTATVTAISLRADETVNAELWLEKEGNGTKVAEQTNQTMTVNTSKTFTLTGNLPLEEGDYEAWVTVKNSDNSCYFNTERIAFTLAHTTSMAVNSLNAVNYSVQADDDNMFTADFTVTLENTGSKTLAANEVSVSITDDHTAEANVYTTKTAAQYVYLYPTDSYTGNNSVIAVWNWSNTTDGEWIATTNMGNGLYIAELKEGKTNFSVVRINPDGTDEDAWNNKWNQSVDLSTSAGNVFTFQSWGEGEGAKDNFSGSAFTLAGGSTLTLPVSVTANAGNGGSFSFNAKENVTGTFYHKNYNVTVNVTAAPKLALNETDNTVSFSEGEKYYEVTLTRPFIAGWNTLVLPFDFAAAQFESATFYAFTENNGGELKFTKVTDETLTAGTPYLVYLTAAISDAKVFSKVTTGAATATDVEQSGAHFIGNYAAGLDMEGKYGVTPAGEVKKGGAGSTMKAFRAYITMPAGQEARIALFDEATGINRVLTSKEVENLNIFNLKGQKVYENAKGVIIVNGKKQVVK